MVITNTVKWQTNVEELKKNMLDGVSTVEQMKASIDRTATSLGGQGLFGAATRATLAVEQLGGVTKLTSGEQDRINTLLEKAIDKYEAMGLKAPPAILQLAAATQQNTEALTESSNALERQTDLLPGFIGKYLEARTIYDLAKESYQGFTALLGGSIESYGKAEQAEVRLAGGLAATGQVMPGILDAYQQYADELEHSTTVSHTAALAAEGTFTLIGSVGPEQMQKALRATADFSAVTGKSFDDAALAIAKATDGNVGQLKRYGIEIDKAEVENKGIGVVFDAIETKMHGQAELLAGTMLGSWQQVGHQWERAEEQLGQRLAPAVTLATHVLGGFVGVVAESPGTFLTFIGASTAMAGSMVWMVAVQTYGAQFAYLAGIIGGTLTQNVVVFATESSVAQGSVLGLSTAEVTLTETSAVASGSILGLSEATATAATTEATATTNTLALASASGVLTLSLGALALIPLGKMIADWTGFTAVVQKWITSADDASLKAAELGAHQDVLANASRIAGHAITDFGEAQQIVNDFYHKGTEAADEHARITKKVQAAIEDAHSSWTQLSGDQVESIKYYLQEKVSVEETATIMGVYKHQVEQIKAQLEEAAKATKKHAEESAHLQKVVDDLNAASVALNATDQLVVITQHERGVGEQEIAKYIGATEAQVRALIKADEARTREAASLDAIRRSIEKTANAESLKQYEAWAKSADAAADRVAKTILQESAIEEDYLRKRSELMSIGDDKIVTEWAAALAKLGPPMQGFEAQWQRSVDAIDNYFTAKLSETAMSEAVKAAGTDSALSFTHGFARVVDDIPNLLKQALTGGGGVSGAMNALGALLGEELGRSLAQGRGGQAIADGLASLFHVSTAAGVGKIATGVSGAITAGAALAGSGALGSALQLAATGASIGTMIMPGIGTAIGAGVGLAAAGIQKLVSMTKASAAELAGRDVEGKFEQSFGGFDKMLTAIGSAYDATGRGASAAQADVQALLAAEKQGGPAVQAMIDHINQAFADEKQHAADIATGVTGIVDAAKAMGSSMPSSFKPLLANLMEAKGLTNDEKMAINGLIATNPDFNSLEQEAAGLGITLEQLGPKFQQAHVDQVANSYVDSFNKLVDAGGDVGGIITGMSPKINAVVKDALQFGVAVPASMKPMLEKMIELGLLTDDSGKKLTDLSKFNFDDSQSPLDKAADKLTKAIDHLGDLLNNLPGIAGTAATGIANSLNGIQIDPIKVKFVGEFAGDDTGPGNFAATGGLVTNHGIQYLDSGGVVLPFTPRGSDTVPAMLTPGEAVLTRGAVATLGVDAIRQLNRGGSGGGATVVQFSTAALERRLQRLEEQLVSESRRTPERVAVAVAGVIARDGRRGRR